MLFVESVWWMRMYQVPGPTSSQKGSSSYFLLVADPVGPQRSAMNMTLPASVRNREQGLAGLLVVDQDADFFLAVEDELVLVVRVSG